MSTQSLKRRVQNLNTHKRSNLTILEVLGTDEVSNLDTCGQIMLHLSKQGFKFEEIVDFIKNLPDFGLD